MSERVRFQADANLNALIIRGLLRRQPHVDIQTEDVGKPAESLTQRC